MTCYRRPAMSTQKAPIRRKGGFPRDHSGDGFSGGGVRCAEVSLVRAPFVRPERGRCWGTSEGGFSRFLASLIAFERTTSSSKSLLQAAVAFSTCSNRIGCSPLQITAPCRGDVIGGISAGRIFFTSLMLLCRANSPRSSVRAYVEVRRACRFG